MTNALDFFTPKDLFDFGSMPVFKSFFGDFVPTNFTNSPKVNVKETDKAYEIEIANPGFGKEDTKIEVQNGVIYVSMTSESKEDEGDEKKYHCKQWSKSSYSESWNIPDNVIEDDISAKNENGVLIITLPKKEPEPNKQDNPRTIEIK